MNDRNKLVEDTVEPLVLLIFVVPLCGLMMGVLVWFYMAFTIGWWVNPSSRGFVATAAVLGELISFAAWVVDRKQNARNQGLAPQGENHE